MEIMCRILHRYMRDVINQHAVVVKKRAQIVLASTFLTSTYNFKSKCDRLT